MFCPMPERCRCETPDITDCREKGSGTSRYEYDAVQHGPLIGLTASF
jgi:hypothetical protein